MSGGLPAGAGGGVAVIALRYGLGTYVRGILRLLSMPSEASEYTVYSMVVQQLRNYLQNCIWLGYLVLIMALGLLVYVSLSPKGKWIKYTAYVVCVCWGFCELVRRSMFNMRSCVKLSVFF